jgi:hypothetical protein
VDNTFAPTIDANSKQIAAKRLSDLSGFQAGDYDYPMDDTDITGSHRRFDLTDAEEAALMTAHNDVGARLQLEGKLISKHKMQLVREREMETAATMEQARASRGTNMIARTNPVVGASFDERQSLLLKQTKEKQVKVQREVEQEGDKWCV